MIYSLAEITRISGSRLAVKDRIYIDVKGNRYKGTIDNRLVQLSISDASVGVKVDNTNTTQDLGSYLDNLVSTLTDAKLKQVEVDFGDELYINEKIFNISDPVIRRGDIISSVIAFDAPTGKQVDELEMDHIICYAGNTRDGGFDLIVKGLSGNLRNKFKINYNKQWQL